MVLSWGFICCSDRSRIVDAPDVPDTLVVLNLSLHQSGDERELLDETCFRTPAICEARTRVSGMRVVTAGSGPSSWATRKFCASGGSSARRGAGAVRARPHVCCPARSWRQRAQVHQGPSGRVASLRMHSPSWTTRPRHASRVHATEARRAGQRRAPEEPGVRGRRPIAAAERCRAQPGADGGLHGRRHRRTECLWWCARGPPNWRD